MKQHTFMKTMLSAIVAVMVTAGVSAQETTKMTRRNSWIKAGVNMGIPIAKLGDQSGFALGAEVKGQLMSTPHWGLGLASGYTHYFPKDGHENFGSVPLGIFGRYYPARSGVFAGAELGYSFQTGSHLNGNGGMYVRPQIGYHNRLWNIFGFYNGVFRKSSNGGAIQYLGIGTTFNIMFN